MNFSWVPFYRELAGRVLEFEDKQDELLELDWSEKSRTGVSNTKAIDPFTFFLNLDGNENAFALLKSRLKLESPIPNDFHGRALPQAGALRFHHHDDSSQVADLWRLARQVNESAESVESSLFAQCAKRCTPIQNHHEGFERLIIGSSWLNPVDFLPGLYYGPLELEVDWEQQDNRFSNPNFKNYKSYLESIKEVTSTPFYELVFQSEPFDEDEPPNPPQTEQKDSPAQSMKNTPLNQILYGPPGTGKTFRSVSKAVELIDGSAPENRAECQKRFHELRAKGQIGFVTFHQSFSYEEFIEGLRPVLDNEDGQAKYEIRDGVLKTIAKSAQKVSFNQSPLLPFIEMIITGTVEVIQGDSTVPISSLIDNIELTSDGIFSVVEGAKRYASMADIETVYEISKSTRLRRFDLEQMDLDERSNPALTLAVVRAIKRLANENTVQVNPNQNNDHERFVLIIDEINRGNISKILGELITLLEDDKRLGEPNELRLTLPVSGETFALPPNLFILGTMNTADKSLAQLDVALRRRFSFIEMAPDFNVCEGLSPDIKAVLERLNERIEWSIDREHRLGHASWMEVKTAADFNRVWREKAMPLLVELFADNLEGLRELLGDGDSQSGFVRPFEAPQGMKGRARLRLYLDCDDAKFDALATLKKNLGVA